MGKRKRNRPGPRRRRAAGLGGVGAALALLVSLILFISEGPGRQVSAPDPVAPVAVPQAGPGMEEGLQVYFLDVGQGDSQLIRIPGEGDYFNVLVDTGEAQYAQGLAAYLEGLGVERIDALLCTHPHADHMGAMAYIVGEFEIGSVYMPLLPEDQTPTTHAYEALMDQILEKGLVVTQLYADVPIDCPAGAEFQVVAPEKDQEWEDVNNYSAVIRLSYGETSFLFTGDAEADSEAEMLAGGYNLEADVLKVGHHGSSTSTSREFLEAVDPEFAVISCGADNRYGHPHQEVLDRLAALPGLTVYRTDRDGTILAQSDGEAVAFQTGLDPVEAEG